MTVTVVDRGEHEGKNFEIRKTTPDARWGKNWQIRTASYAVVFDGEIAVHSFPALKPARELVGKFQAQGTPKPRKGRKTH